MSRFESYSRFQMWSAALLLSALTAGCGGGSEGRDPILGADLAALAPRVTAVTPLANAVGVPISTKIITAAFSKAMNPATLAATGSFTLTCPGYVPGGAFAVTYLAAGNVATLTLPAAPDLPPSIVCTATVTTAAKDTAGIPLASNFVWTFTTGVTPDTTRPRVTLTAPVTTIPGPTPAVPTNTAITAVFSEAMAPGSITAASFTVTCAAPCVSPAGAVSYAVGSRTAVFTPAAVLAAGTTYTATIKGTGATPATDLALNALAGNDPLLPLPAASDYVWTFTTAAAVPAANVSVASTNPVAGAAAVCPTATVNATFTVPSGLRMDPLTVNATTFTVTGPGPTSVTAASVALDVPTGRIATFTPLAALPVGLYTAQIVGGAAGVKDLAVPGNTQLADFTWTFTVVACPPPLAPAATPFGVAYPFAIAATAGVTNTATAPNTTINGDVVLDPLATCNAVAVGAAGTFGLCGGFPPTLNGTVFSPLSGDGGVVAAAVKLALRAAFLTITPPAGPPAVGSQVGVPTNLPAGTTLGAPTGSALVQGDNLFAPGLYQSTTSILITDDVTLDGQGDPNAVFVFQSSTTIGTADGAASPAAHPRILLINGARASNVYWQAATSATLGTFTEWQGNLLASASITMKTGATSCGRLFAGSFTDGAFVFDSNVVSVPDVSC